MKISRAETNLDTLAQKKCVQGGASAPAALGFVNRTSPGETIPIADCIDVNACLVCLADTHANSESDSDSDAHTDPHPDTEPHTDAHGGGSDVDLDSETRLPPGTQYHVNYYQRFGFIPPRVGGLRQRRQGERELDWLGPPPGPNHDHEPQQRPQRRARHAPHPHPALTEPGLSESIGRPGHRDGVAYRGLSNVVLNILYLLSLASMIPLATAVWRRRTAPGAPGLLVQIIGIAIWCFGYGLENASWTPWWKLLGTKIGYIGIVMVPLSWLMFTAKFLRGRPLPNGWIVGLAVIPAITLIAVWTNGLEGGLQWSRLEFDPPHLRLTPGPWYWVAYGYSTVVFVIATWSVIRGLSHSTKLMRRQARVLLAAALIPWIANVTYTTGLSPWPDVDLAPFAFGLAAVLVTWSLLRIGFLDLAPIARGIAVEQMRDGWIVVDHRGRVVDLNPAAERFLGRPTSLVNGCDLADILPEGPDALRLAHDKTGRLESAGIEIARGNLGDRRWYELRAWPLKERSGHFVGDMLVMQDRTESIVIARSLADARDLAQSADDAKSDFLATMSHEIRTPIHGILGMTEILLDSDLQDEQRECAERSRAATLNLLNIINDILDFSKIEAGKLILEREPFELRRVVDETLGLVATAAVEKKLALTSTIEPGVPEQVLGDVGRIRQILLNLVANAVKFTETGEVAVRVDACRNGGPKDRLHFEVRDTGIGIPDEAKEKLFESFSQVGPSIARNYGGTGLGLAIVKRLVEQMGGEVGFESAPGAGSTFWFRVPLAAETAGSTASGN